MRKKPSIIFPTSVTIVCLPISRCSKLFYIILSKYFYFESRSCTASACPALSHIARYAPECRTSSYGTITQFKCKNNYEHLLMYPLLSIPKEQHLFKQGVSFGKVMMLYRFDKKLRLLLFNEIEKIEVAVRCAVVNFGTEMTGNPFWMTDASNFSNPSKFNRSMRLIEDELNHTKEDFINHFKETYTNQYPPSWMLTEILPFGVITNVYSNIKNKKIKKRIAQSFGLQVAPFESWLTIITLTRNSCCHHARVWNRVFSIRATMPIRMSRPWITLPTDPLKVYFDMCIIKYFLDIISPNNDMLDKMNRLFATFPEVDKAALGFPFGWENEPLWH